MAVETPPVPASAPTPLRDLITAALADLYARNARKEDIGDAFARIKQTGLLNGAWVAAIEEERPAAPEDAPLLALAGKLGLSPLEILSVALVAALDEDPVLGRVVGALQAPSGSSRPSLALLSLAFEPIAGGQVPIQVLTSGAAMTSGLFSFDGDTRPLSERAPTLRPATYLALRDRDGVWPGATIGMGSYPEVRLPPSTLERADRYAEALTSGERALVIRTGSPTEARAVACAIAASLGRRAVFLEDEAVDGLAPWLILRDLVPVFCYDLGPGDKKRIPAMPHYDGPLLALAGPDGSVQAAGSGVPDWFVGVPPASERRELWIAALGEEELAASLAAEHRHAAGRIAHLGRLVHHRLVLEGTARPTRAHVQAAAWISEAQGLAGLATPLPDPVPEGALVTGEALRAELELLLLRCRARDGLSDRLGASIQARYHPGVRALLVGPSGTGKTLAAGWLATRLGIPLYRVDLAAVTSKYIGETEKNLAQLLARAEYAEVVLLFDEADSMFGKRTDVKDSNDRFANAQTNYLLQRIESFDGITLLTSNSRARFDVAFTRRLDAVLDFPLPGPEERRGLWASHLGSGHTLTPRMVNKLAATVDLAGGHIRNVVIAAAVLAGARGQLIEYQDIVAGLTAEFRKLGRQVPQEMRSED